MTHRSRSAACRCTPDLDDVFLALTGQPKKEEAL